MIRYLGAVLFVISGSAAAQTVATTCNGYLGTLYCNSTTQPTYTPPQIQQFDATKALDAYAAGRRNVAPPSSPMPQDAFEEELMKRMALHARAGRCKEAHELAILAGEYDLAVSSQKLCPF